MWLVARLLGPQLTAAMATTVLLGMFLAPPTSSPSLCNVIWGHLQWHWLCRGERQGEGERGTGTGRERDRERERGTGTGREGQGEGEGENDGDKSFKSYWSKPKQLTPVGMNP